MTTMTSTSKFVGIEEAAKMLGVSYSTVWESLRRGDFPVAHVRIGTKWRISRPGLEALTGEAADRPETAAAPNSTVAADA